MTLDQQSTGRKPRRFRGSLRVAAVGSALCLAAGMGISMATQASAAPRPGPGGFPGHRGVLPVCISFGGVLRLALPFSTCNGPIVPLEIAGFDDHHRGPSGITTDVHSRSSNGLFDTVTAQCDPGEVATGGGFSASSLGAFFLNTDEPTDNNGNPVGPGVSPTAWTVGFGLPATGVGTGPDHPTYTAYVVFTPGPSMGGGPGGGSGDEGGAGSGLGSGTGGLSSPAHAARHH